MDINIIIVFVISCIIITIILLTRRRRGDLPARIKTGPVSALLTVHFECAVVISGGWCAAGDNGKRFRGRRVCAHARACVRYYIFIHIIIFILYYIRTRCPGEEKVDRGRL